MLERDKKLILTIAGIFCFLSFFIFVSPSRAATSTLRGSAYWGSDYGYLSFNCLDDVTGNFLGESNNLSGGNTFQGPWWDDKNEFHFSYDACLANGHKVELSDSGALLGKAWSPKFGFINFSYDGGEKPSGPNNNFPSQCLGLCGPGVDCQACYSFDTQELYGFAKIEDSRLSGTNAKWIKLDNVYPGKPAFIYTNEGSSLYPGYNLELGDLAGSARTFLGNRELSFNCLTETGAKSCANAGNYKVYIKDLNIGRLSAPNWTFSQACGSNAKQATLKWEKFSGIQTRYEVLVSKGNGAPETLYADYLNNPSNPNYIYKSATSAAQQVTIYASQLEYNQAYYWWVRVFDEENKPTEWMQYNTNNRDLDSDRNRDNNPLTFQTFEHEMPSPFFSWDPPGTDIKTSSSTTFISESRVYTKSSPKISLPCYTGLCGYNWSTDGVGAEIKATTSPETEMNFAVAANTIVKLEVTDESGYTCSKSTSFNINYDLPLWREVKVETYTN